MLDVLSCNARYRGSRIGGFMSLVICLIEVAFVINLADIKVQALNHFPAFATKNQFHHDVQAHETIHEERTLLSVGPQDCPVTWWPVTSNDMNTKYIQLADVAIGCPDCNPLTIVSSSDAEFRYEGDIVYADMTSTSKVFYTYDEAVCGSETTSVTLDVIIDTPPEESKVIFAMVPDSNHVDRMEPAYAAAYQDTTVVQGWGLTVQRSYSHARIEMFASIGAPPDVIGTSLQKLNQCGAVNKSTILQVKASISKSLMRLSTPSGDCEMPLNGWKYKPIPPKACIAVFGGGQPDGSQTLNGALRNIAVFNSQKSPSDLDTLVQNPGQFCPSPSPDVTPVTSSSPSSTFVASATSTSTASSTASASPTCTSSSTATRTATPSISSIPSASSSTSSTATGTSTSSVTSTVTSASTATSTNTATSTATTTSTSSVTSTATTTSTAISTSSMTSTATTSSTATSTSSMTSTATATSTSTRSASFTSTATLTSTATSSSTPTPTNTATPSMSPSMGTLVGQLEPHTANIDIIRSSDSSDSSTRCTSSVLTFSHDAIWRYNLVRSREANGGQFIQMYNASSSSVHSSESDVIQALNICLDVTNLQPGTYKFLAAFEIVRTSTKQTTSVSFNFNVDIRIPSIAVGPSTLLVTAKQGDDLVRREITIRNDGTASLHTNMSIIIPQNGSNFVFFKDTMTDTLSVNVAPHTSKVISILFSPAMVNSTGTYTANLMVRTNIWDVSLSGSTSTKTVQIPLEMRITAVYVCPEIISVNILPMETHSFSFEVVNIDKVVLNVSIIAIQIGTTSFPSNLYHQTELLDVDDLPTWLQLEQSFLLLLPGDRESLQGKTMYNNDTSSTMPRSQTETVSQIATLSPGQYDITFHLSVSLAENNKNTIGTVIETRSIGLHLDIKAGEPDATTTNLVTYSMEKNETQRNNQTITVTSSTSMVATTVWVELRDSLGFPTNTPVETRIIYGQHDIPTKGKNTVVLRIISSDPSDTLLNKDTPVISVDQELKFLESLKGNGIKLNIFPTRLGNAQIEIFVAGQRISNFVTVHVLGPNCNQSRGLYPSADGLNCSCLAGMYASSSSDGIICIPCEEGTFSASAGLASTCSPCPQSFFSPSGATQCDICPSVGFTCFAGHLRMKNGYWCEDCVDTRASTISRLASVQNNELHIIPCTNPSSCSVNASTFQVQCTEGSEGPLCGSCSNGWARVSQTMPCSVCWASAANWCVTLLIFFLFMTLVCIVVIKQFSAWQESVSMNNSTLYKAGIAPSRRKEHRKRILMGSIRISLNYLQIIGLLMSLKTAPVDALRSVFGIAGAAASASPFDSNPVICALGLTFISKTIILLLFPVIIALLAFCTLMIVRQLRPHSANAAYTSFNSQRVPYNHYKDINHSKDISLSQSFKYTWRDKFVLLLDQLATPVIALWMITHMAITKAALSVFNTLEEPIYGTTRLLDDPRISTSSAMYGTLSAFAVLVLLLFTLGLPLMLAKILISRRKRLTETSVLARWSFLYSGLRTKQGLYLWECVVIILRKGSLVCVATVMSSGIQQATLIYVLLSIALLLHLALSPYQANLLNSLDSMQQAVLVISQLLATVIFRLETTEYSSAVVDVLTILIILLNLFTSITLLICVVAHASEKVGKLLERMVIRLSQLFEAVRRQRHRNKLYDTRMTRTESHQVQDPNTTFSPLYSSNSLSQDSSRFLHRNMAELMRSSLTSGVVSLNPKRQDNRLKFSQVHIRKK